jgi:hypothetical protein
MSIRNILNNGKLTLLSNRTQVVEFRCDLTEQQIEEIDSYMSQTPNLYNESIYDKLFDMGVVFEIDTEWNEIEDFFEIEENNDLKNVIQQLKPKIIKEFKFFNNNDTNDEV